MLTGLAIYAGSAVSKSVRKGLKTRHKRKLAVIEARREEWLTLETARQERREPAAARKPPEPVCGCTHHLAKHDKKGKCHELVQVPVAWDADHKPVQYEARQCTCQQYMGPQPHSQVYAEDLTDLA
ncbi:hypothetical protein AB5J72_40825 [Streptomyces sp. CG1]|uniref:hypothetical protein n=1 Tax=Streptomyces sp. CG1 TaxID=1287523 RepID=UPI0034E2EF2E